MIAFERTGADGPPILLVMGLGMPGAMWRPVADVLGATYQVATFDHRGVGRTPGPARDRISDLVDDTIEVLDGLGWNDAHVVGVSMGGMIAQELALRVPDRLRSLTLIATHAGGPLAVVPPLRGLLALAGPRGPRRFSRILHPPGVRAAMAERSADAARSIGPPETVRAHFQAVRRHDTRARLGAITAPTLVVKPGCDVLVRPSHSDRLASGIPGARLEVLPDAGHGLIAHAVDPLCARIVDHVRARAPR